MSLVADADVAIIGAGLAGAGAAITLARRGVRVVLIDPRETYQACFKAEKIEPDQAELLRKFGLLEGVLPFASRIHKVISARNGSVLRVLCLEQYGIFYQDIVNSVRRQIPASVDWKTARVHDVSPGSDISRLTFMDGTTMSARLIVLASGAGGNLSESLGIQRQMIRENQSFAIGFNMSREDGRPFSFEALTYYPDDAAERIAFLTLFPIQDVMRANLFVYRSPGEDWVSRFKRTPREEIVRVLPELNSFTGPFLVSSRIEMCPVDLYRVSGHVRPGLVLIGDAYQSVCPATGTGLSKVLTDVDVLSECVLSWLETPGMVTEKICRYYEHPRKIACDENSIRQAQHCRALSTNVSTSWTLYRGIRYAGVRMLGWMERLSKLVGKGAENACPY
jgi:2-polyprenyl-6-methoxyphenol hydroxylase-like FAD-dependent oxidoreductase